MEPYDLGQPVSNDATVYVPDEMYRWTLYDAPVTHDTHLQAVYRHDEFPYWLAISPIEDEPRKHEAILFTESGVVVEQAITDTQCLLNILTREDSVLNNCKIKLDDGTNGSESDAYEAAGLD